MSTIRNLSGAPSYGSSAIDSERGGRRRALSYTFDGDLTSSAPPSLTSRLHLAHRRDRHPHHLAGEVIGPSVLQPSQSFPYRPRIPSISNYNNSIIVSSSRGETPVRNNNYPSLRPPSPSSKMPPPTIGSGIHSNNNNNNYNLIRKLRSSTWDSAGMHRSATSPTSMSLIRSRSDSRDFNSSPDSVIWDNRANSNPIGSRTGGNLSDGVATMEMLENDSSSSSSSSEHDDSDLEEEGSISRTSLHSLVRNDDNHMEEQEKMNLHLLTSTCHAQHDVSFATDEAVDLNDLAVTKSVSFLDIVHEPYDHNDLEPRLLQLESNNSNDEGSDILPSSAPSYHGSQTMNRDSREKSKLNPFANLSYSLMGSCIVRYAPCFWCSKKLGSSPTDREILLRLNLLCVFFGGTQFIIGLVSFFFRYAGYTKDVEDAKKMGTGESLVIHPLVSIDLWSLQTFVYTLSLLGAVLGIGSILAQRSIREVNLVGSVRWMWCLFWLLPIQIFFMIGLFDYYSVNAVHTRHWWGDPSMRTSREMFCLPNTANAQCKVPILGGIDYPSEKKWCIDKYNSTDCTEIRDSAQGKYVVTSQLLYTSIGIWACVFALLLWLTLCVLQAIITLPIVQRSKESNIPLWLTFPIIGCYTIGYLLFSSQSAVTHELQDVYWIALVYLLSGGAFTLAALVGYFLKFYTVLNGRQRRFKQGVVVLFISTIILTIFTVATIFATSLIYALNIVDVPLDQYSLLACYLDSDGSCTGCGQDDPLLMCPEWTEDDVRRVLETIMKQSATLAAIFLVYALITLRYGFVLFRHVSRYQIEYV